MPRASRKPDVIRAAAQKLFLRSGLRRTSMDAIAAEAKVSKQTLYSHFGSKDQLFVEVLRSLTIEELHEDVLDLVPASPVSRDQLEATLLVVATRILDSVLNPTYLDLVRVVIAESRDFPELVGLFRSAVIERVAAVLVRLLTVHAAAAVPASQVQSALRLFVGPLLSYELEGLVGDPSDAKRLAHAELPAVVRLFVAAISR